MSTDNAFKHLSERNRRNMDIPARAIIAPSIGISHPTEVNVYVGQPFVVKSVSLQLPLHVRDGAIQSSERDNVHGVRMDCCIVFAIGLWVIN